MKKLLSFFLFFPFLLLFSTRSHAQAEQDNKPQTTWVSTKGYWVVESNKHTPKESVIYFYTNDNLLMYKKEVKNQKLKLNNQQTLFQLKATLEDAIAAYQNGVAANREKMPINLVQH